MIRGIVIDLWYLPSKYSVSKSGSMYGMYVLTLLKGLDRWIAEMMFC